MSDLPEKDESQKSGVGLDFHDDGRTTLNKPNVNRLKAKRPAGWRAAWLGLVVLVVAGLILALALTPIEREPLSPARADASAALQALEDGDLAALDQRLAANIGSREFAYFFASEVSPRSLGDALATVTGEREAHGSAAVGRSPAMELVLTDLAGAVALATHGTGDRALPTSWTTQFIEATTTPDSAGTADRTSDESEQPRVRQDTASQQNLLLLLSRGYWSTDFLRKVTRAFWEFDRRRGGAAWTRVAPVDGVHAPGNSDTHLTDGMLALTAALTANPSASKWAFTHFQPGTTTIEGTGRALGKFTHYLVFEHEYPTSPKGESIGMTATLTALSSAIVATTGTAGTQPPTPPPSSPTDSRPMRDADALRAFADELTDDSRCSWNPGDYWHCVKEVAEAVLRWIQKRGHLVLEILSLSPPPFDTAASTINATWYAIEGDYRMAGLSLAAAIPLLEFVKIAKSLKGLKGGLRGKVAAELGAETASQVERRAEHAAGVAKRARAWRLKPWNDCGAVVPGGLTLRYGKGWTDAQRQAADEKTKALFEAARRGELKRTTPERAGKGSDQYKKTGGSIPDGADLDHTIDLQLGGSDDARNMKPLDTAVNRSLGIQIAQQLKLLALDQRIPAVAIC